MIPLNLGVRAHDIQAASREELGEKLAYYQFSHIQFAVKKSFPAYAPTLRSVSSGTASFIGDYLQNLGIKISILGCYVNLASPDEAIRQQAIADFKHHIYLAKDYHAAVVGTETGSVGHGYTTANFTEEAYIAARSSIMEMVAYAEHLGVTVGIEAGINHPLYTSDLAKRLISEVQSPNLKIIMDCANLISTDNYQEQERVVYRALNDLHDDICSMHLKDFIIENQQVRIVPVGTGWMKYDQILQFLKKDKPLMFASLEATTEPDIPHAIDVLQKGYDHS